MPEPLQLCLIARDEERLLPGCLTSVEGWVDRVVVVDTGSTDATIALAEAAGATVARRAWDEDFAAARNAGLDALEPGWMLVLDADERLAAGAGAAIRAAIEEGGFDAGLLPVHNAATVDAAPDAVLSGAARLGEPTLLARLFRLSDDLRWVGALHEQLASAAGRTLVQKAVHAPILHLGYAPSELADKDKHARNLGILRRMTAEGGDDPVPWCYLARDASRAGLLDEARAAAEQAWARLDAALSPGAPHASLPPATLTLATLRADLQLGAGQLAEALQTLSTARSWGGDHPNLDLMEATLRLAQAARLKAGARRRQLRGAEQAAQRARAAHGAPQTDEISAGATSWLAAVRQGEARLQLGQDQAALEAFREAAALLPKHPRDLAAQAAIAARVGAAEVLTRHDPGKALQLLEPLLTTPFPDPWAVAAEACRKLGKTDDAALFAQQGRDRRAVGWLSSHRAALLR